MSGSSGSWPQAGAEAKTRAITVRAGSFRTLLAAPGVHLLGDGIGALVNRVAAGWSVVMANAFRVRRGVDDQIGNRALIDRPLLIEQLTVVAVHAHSGLAVRPVVGPADIRELVWRLQARRRLLDDVATQRTPA